MPGQKITVRVAGNDQKAVRSVLEQAGLGTSTTVVPVEHSLADLKALTARIAVDFRNGKLRGLDIVEWGPNVSSNKVLFYLNRHHPASVRQLLARYGATWVTVSSQLRSEPHRTADQFHDTYPYWGGDAIWIHGEPIDNDCTSGIPTVGRGNGKTYMLTAGHCANVGQKIDTNFTAPRTMGSVTNKRFVNGGLDAETIGGGYGPRIWSRNGSASTLIGSGDVPPGEGSYSLVTINGSETGERRKLLVTANDQCLVFGGVETCYLSVVKGFVAEGGDSGGPVYQYSSNGLPQVYAAGIVVASDADYDFTVYQQISDMENWFNVRTFTG